MKTILTKRILTDAQKQRKRKLSHQRYHEASEEEKVKRRLCARKRYIDNLLPDKERQEEREKRLAFNKANKKPRSKISEEEQKLRKAKSRRKYYERKKENDPTFMHHRNAQSKQWRLDHPELSKSYYVNYSSNHKEELKKRAKLPKIRFAAAKRKAIIAHREWTLLLEEYLLLYHLSCDYCHGYFNTPSLTGSGLDRKDSSNGYHIDNVVTCCITCNTLKSNILSYEEAKMIIKLVIETRQRKLNVQTI